MSTARGKSSTLHFACWKRTGRTKRLDDPGRGIIYFGQPAISLAGSVLVSGVIEVPEAFDTESDRFVSVEGPSRQLGWWAGRAVGWVLRFPFRRGSDHSEVKRRLDRSRGIEPSSLTVSGSLLRWTKYGKRYSASLR